MVRSFLFSHHSGYIQWVSKRKNYCSFSLSNFYFLFSWESTRILFDKQSARSRKKSALTFLILRTTFWPITKISFTTSANLVRLDDPVVNCLAENVSLSSLLYFFSFTVGGSYNSFQVTYVLHVFVFDRVLGLLKSLNVMKVRDNEDTSTGF